MFQSFDREDHKWLNESQYRNFGTSATVITTCKGAEEEILRVLQRTPVYLVVLQSHTSGVTHLPALEQGGLQMADERTIRVNNSHKQLEMNFGRINS